TERRSYWARVVVGADGSGSVVRRTLVPGVAGELARAVMNDVPVAAQSWDGHAAHRYDFDFRSCPRGLRGYRWTFPCLVDGVPHANVGAYALPPGDGAGPQRGRGGGQLAPGARRPAPVRGGGLQGELAGELPRIGASSSTWKAFPIRTYDES